MRILSILIILLVAQQVCAESNDVLIALRVAKEFNLTPYQTKLLLAIRCTENGKKGKEYGVLSIFAPTQEDQAKVTARSILNNWKRWEKSGKSEDFISFMAKRWCPIELGNDPRGLNQHWVNNVRYFMEVMIEQGK